MSMESMIKLAKRFEKKIETYDSQIFLKTASRYDLENFKELTKQFVTLILSGNYVDDQELKDKSDHIKLALDSLINRKINPQEDADSETLYDTEQNYNRKPIFEPLEDVEPINNSKQEQDNVTLAHLNKQLASYKVERAKATNYNQRNMAESKIHAVKLMIDNLLNQG